MSETAGRSSRRSSPSSSARRSEGSTWSSPPLDRALEAVQHQDVELASDGHRRRRPHRRPLPRGAPGDPVAARAPGAGRRRPASGRRAAARDQARRAHGRPVREHRQAGAARGSRAARRRPACWTRSSRWASRHGQQVVQAGQAFAARDVGLAQDLVRQDDEIDRLNRESSRWRSTSATTPTGANGRCT